ncbi:MAG: hypothetical protein COA96_06825 [SAR86 cluster bacterium]|uniref:DUF1302 domain-containing protein n=1 Tax=SAR86 cluster bacterium TaxID=2030880 RepID=A0A2A5B2D8_9GAMM|nr:MAG: hypothetical protein COA96_06825 [SAR86 cluster bacterium]
MIRNISKARKLSTRLLVNACLLVSPLAIAQDDFFSTVNVDTSNNSSRSSENYSVIGWITQSIAQGLEEPGPLFTRQEKEPTKIETSLFGQLDGRVNDDFNFRISGKIYHDAIYRVNDETSYSEDERNEFRNRFEVKDLYLERQFENGFYLKVGNQILAWGLAEYLRVTDLINTEDQITFGQQDLEDLRLQVPAVLLSYTRGDWTFDSVYTYKAGRNDIAPMGDEFDQLAAQRNAGLSLLRNDPATDSEYFFRATTHLSKGDLQIVAGEFNDNSLSVDQLDALLSISPLVTYSQNRMRAIGIAANWVEGSFLFFGELGIHFDKAVRPNQNSFFKQLNGWDEKDQLLSVVGIEYSGFRNLLLSFEIDSINTQQHDAFMDADENQISFGSRLYWTALNERLQVLAVWNELADNRGHVSRLSVEYNWSDSLDFGLMWVDYGSSDGSIFYDFRNNDVLQLQLKFNFQI